MIVKEGWPFVIGFSVLGIVCISLVSWVGEWGAFGAAVFFIAACGTLFFFRNPPRIIKKDDRLIYAAGDGIIMDVAAENLSGGGSRTVVKIFLSIFDVHVQRSPVTGVVEDIQYREGAFLPALHKDAAARNEQNTLYIKNDRGTVAVTQIAGIIARRIVSWAQKGNAVEQGQRIGLICFGSQVDMFLPGSAQAIVCKGDRVRAGLTVIGEWR